MLPRVASDIEAILRRAVNVTMLLRVADTIKPTLGVILAVCLVRVSGVWGLDDRGSDGVQFL